MAFSPARPSVIFDLSSTGHHGEYVRYILRYWLEARPAHRLVVVVSSALLRLHEDLMGLCEKQRSRIDLVSVSEDDVHKAESGWYSLLRRSVFELNLLGHYAREFRAMNCLALNFDVLQPAICLIPRFPCPLSGIYFRPSFYYQTSSLHARLRGARRRLLLAKCLRRSYVQRILSLDPLAVDYAARWWGTNKVAWLADPIECPVDGEVGEGGHTEDGIWEDRRPFRLLLFGHITRRKGAGNLLRALELLPRQVCQLTSLAIVGKVEDGYRAELAQAVARTLQGTSARVVVVDEFVKDETVERLIRTASVVMAPYLEHEGMSGVLLHAAAQGKPVVTSTHGLIGMLTRENKLGFAVDCGHPGEIARALNELFGPGTNPEFDREGAMFFARQHHYSQYGARIAETLTLNSSRLSEEQL